jgi:O-antigen/teichoic acid export membrane protein
MLIARRSFLIMFSKFVAAGLGFIALSMMMRYVPEEYGSIMWAMSLGATFNAIADLGMGAAHIKRISEGQDLSDCLATYAMGKLLLTMVMVSIFLGSLFVYTVMLGNRIYDTSMEVIVLFTLYWVFFDLAAVATQTFDARMQTAKTQFSFLMDSFVRVPLLIILAVNRLDDLFLAYAYVLGGMSLAITALALLAREGNAFGRPKMFRSYLAFALPLAPITVISAISLNIDKVLLGFFWSNLEVSYYASAYNFLLFFSTFGMAISTLTFPAFSKMHAEGRLEEIKAKTRQAERYVSLIGMPILAVLVVFPDEVASILFGGHNSAVGGPLRFLAVSMYLNLINYVYTSQLKAVNRPDLVAKVVFMQLAVNLTLLILLIPNSIFGQEVFGLRSTGAGIANMMGVMTLFILTRYAVYRLTGTTPDPSVGKHAIAGTVVVLVLILMSSGWGLARWYDLIGYGGLALAVFGALLVAMKELTKDDVRFFLNVVNPVEMGRYLRSELKK